MAKYLTWLSAGAVAVALGVGGVIVTATVSAQREIENRVIEAAAQLAPVPAPVAPRTPATPGDFAEKLNQQAANPALADVTGAVIDTATGELVWAKDPDRPIHPASTTKVLTSAAALMQLGPEYRSRTTVIIPASTNRGGKPGSFDGRIYLVGGGDVMLYREQVAELARDTAASLAEQGLQDSVREVVVDLSRWSPEAFAPTWDRLDIAGGYVAPVQSFTIRAGRIDGTDGDIARTDTPAQLAADVFAQELAAALPSADPFTVTLEYAPAAELAGTQDFAELAGHDTPPLWQRLNEMMDHSDNVAAEGIAKEIAVARGTDSSSPGAARAVLEVLQEHGIDTTGVNLADASGLSQPNLIPARVLAETLAASIDNPQISSIFYTLPTAGTTGTLSARFGDTTARGWVRAKTGTLTGVSGLAGYVPALDGHVYAFAFISNGSEIAAARPALDRMAATIYAP